MGADEEDTLERLKALRRELLDPKIAEHHGRVVKTTGDGMLVEFASVVDAVRCAVAVQQAMPERDTGVAADSRIELRIGINLGDVIVEGDDLYGDGPAGDAPCTDRRCSLSKTSVSRKSGSHWTHRWRKGDSNLRSLSRLRGDGRAQHGKFVDHVQCALSGTRSARPCLVRS